jgi:ankyrin repeat protein
MDPDDADNYGMTALHVACDAGRAHNIEVLLARANEGLFHENY